MATEQDAADFFESLRRGDLDRVGELLAKDSALVNAKDEFGLAAVHCAVSNGNVALLKLLLDKNADPRLPDSNGVTPLHWAIREGHGRVASLLLEHHADSSAKDGVEGMTPLHRAVEGEHQHIVELLLAANAEVDSRDRYGFTPLMCAASRGSCEIAVLLLAHGADVNAKNNFDETILDRARAGLDWTFKFPKKEFEKRTENARRMIDILGAHKALGWQKEFSRVMPRKISSKVDWDANKALLLNATRSAVTTFIGELEKGGLCAIGYSFELGNNCPQFDLCAETRTNRSESDDAENPKRRWNSGNYRFPAGLGGCDDLGDEWGEELARLHELTLRYERHFKKVYNGLIAICCETIAELAADGLFGDISQIDFNVAEYGDGIDLVMKRDKEIRRMIKRIEKIR